MSMRRRFQFGIRSLLIVTAVFALLLGLFMQRLRESQRQEAAIEALNCYPFCDDDIDEHGEYNLRASAPPRFPFLRSVLGRHFFDRVTGVSLVDADDEQVMLLANFPGLRRVEVRCGTETNDGMKGLQRLTEIRYLLVRHAPIDDAGLESLRQLRHLEFLNLENTRVRGEGLRHLVQNSNLRILILSRTDLEDPGMAYLSAFPHLKKLWVSNTRITDAGLAPVGNLGELEELGLFGAEIGGPGVETLTSLKQLKRLYCSSTQITDDCLQYIGELEGLEVLDMMDNPVTDNGLLHLRRLKSLKELRIGNEYAGRTGTPSDSQKGTELLEHLSSLEILIAENCDFDDSALERVKHLPKLKTLQINGTKVTSKGVEDACKSLALERLHLDGEIITSDVLKALTSCKTLKDLWIYSELEPEEWYPQLLKTLMPGVDAYFTTPQAPP